MLTNYLKLALRNLVKQRIYFGINVFGLGIALSACLLLLLFVFNELNYDAYHTGADRTYRILTVDTEKDEINGRTPDLLAAALQDISPEVESSVQIYKRNMDFYLADNRPSDETRFIFSTEHFFDIFNVPLLAGSNQLLNDTPNQVLISEKLAKRYFGDIDILGRTIRIRPDNEYIPLEISGVFKDLPANTHLDMDVIVPMSLAKRLFAVEKMMGFTWEMFNNWELNNFSTYIRLREYASTDNVNTQLQTLVAKNLEHPEKTRFDLQPLTQVYLHSQHMNNHNWKQGNLQQTLLLLGIALLILLIAVMNFVILATARSSTRLQEMGLRKTLGAQRADLIVQILTESILTALLALPIAVLLAELALPWFNLLVQKTLALNHIQNWPLLLSMSGLTLMVGLLSGLYIALYFIRYQPLHMLRAGSPLQQSKSIMRKILITGQFVMFIVLLTCTVFIYQQLYYMQHKDLGFNKNMLLSVPLPDNQCVQKYPALKTELLNSPYIENVSGASYTPPTETFIWAVFQTPDNPENKKGIEFIYVDYDYFETMQINAIQGRLFSREFGTEQKGAILLNESAIPHMELKEPVVGQNLMGDNWPIVGVVQDFHIRSLHKEIKPVAFMLSPDNIHNAIIRIKPGQIRNAVQDIKDHWQHINPNAPFSFQFVDEALDQQYRNELRFGQMIQTFTLIAIIVAILGLFGLATFMAEQRTKEIGVRKVLGASISGLLLLLSKEFIQWVLIANVVAWPLAWYATNKWLEQFAYRIHISIWTLVLTGTSALLIALLTVGWQVIKAANADPVKALKYE